MKTTIAAMFTLFVTLVAVGAASAGNVEEIYNKQCASCHGKDGKAQTPVGKRMKMKDLTDAKIQAAATDADWEKAIKDGVKYPDGKSAMPAYNGKISADDTKALVKLCRDMKGK